MACREQLQKSISCDFFKTHPFFFKALPESDIVSTFLDGMERSDEATFNLFMDLLKAYNRPAHHHLKQTLAAIDTLYDDDDDDEDCFLENDAIVGDRVAMSGHMVREVLKKMMRMKCSDFLHKNNPLSSFELNNKDNYVNCFVINSRGEDHLSPWIKHNTTRKKVSKNKSKLGDPYMAVVCKDVVFKMIPDVPPFVRKPVNSSKIYVCDDQADYSSGHNKHLFFNKDTNGSDNFKRNESSKNPKSQKSFRQIIKRSVHSPPPLPPKPDTLSPLPAMDAIEKLKEEVLQQAASEHHRSSLPQRQLRPKLKQSSSTVSIPPPIPTRQKAGFVPKPPPASPPLPATSCNLSRESSTKRSIVSQASKTSINNNISAYPTHHPLHGVDSDVGSDDNVSLNYNVEPENSDELEESYEPINTHKPPTLSPLPTAENTETLCFELAGKKQLHSSIKNSDLQELNNYNNSSIENNDTCNQEDPLSQKSIVALKNAKHDYMVLEASEHDLQGNNCCDDIEDENNCLIANHSDKHENITVSGRGNVKLPLKNGTAKSSGDLNQVFSDYAKILEDLESPERERSASLRVDRSSSIKSEPASHKVSEARLKITESKKISSLKSTLNQDIMELPNDHLLENRMADSTKGDVFVSRSSSGISATISERLATRDSGVDSTVSQNLHDSPFCAKEPFENSNTAAPDSTAEDLLNKFIDENSTKLTEPSYYEDIDHINSANLDSLSQSHYLDPRVEYSKENFSNFSPNSNQKFVSAGSLFITDGLLATTEDNFSDFQASFKGSGDLEKSLLLFTNTVIGYDKDGASYYMPVKCIRRHGDPRDQPWFYPIPLTIKEASVFLRQERQKGCFLVYTVPEETTVPDGCMYMLGVYGDRGEVLHYPIVENLRGDFMVEGDDHSFLNVCDLVQFYKRNRHRLATRLRRCLKESRLTITPGHHYLSNLELPKKSIVMSGKVLSDGVFGPLCLATLYRQQQVVVRMFQQEASVEKEDDFLNEALVLMETDHKNIVRLFGVSFGSKPYYIVMENFGSGTLKDVLSYGSLPSERNEVYYDICLQMTTALAHLEKKRFILHRNISSSSFLISSDNSIKLFNFEKACQVDDDNYEEDSNETISVRWAAPEVLVDNHYSTKSDVWALAVVFWELFSHGKQPYQCMSDQQVIVAVLERCKLDKPVDCDTRIYNLMSQCWKFNPLSRPTSSTLEERLKGQSSVYYMTSNKNPADVLTSLHPFDSQKPKPLLPNKPIKRVSQASPTTPVLFSSAFQFRNSNPYTDGEMRGEDVMKISQISTRSSKRLSSRNAIVDSSSSIHLSNESVSRSSKERKSLKKFFRSRKNV